MNVLHHTSRAGRATLRTFAITMALTGFGAVRADATPAPTPPSDPVTSSSIVAPAPGAEAPLPADDSGGADIPLVQSWALGPANNEDPSQPGNRPILTYDAAPGSVIHDAVTLYNLGNLQLDFHLYATDAYNSPKGEFALLAGDQSPSDIGTWVTLDAGDLTLPPNKQATIPITIAVPADATSGDHSGAVIASHLEAGAGGSNQVVNLDQRTGTPVYVRVSGPLTPDLAITKLDTSYAQAVNPFEGTAHVKFTVVNRGNVRLGGTPTVTVSGPVGIEHKLRLPAISELLPGQHVELSADLEGLPAAFVLSTKVEMTPVGTGALADIKTAEASDTTFAPPLFALMILLVLLVGTLARRAFRRHRQEDDESDHLAEDDPSNERGAVPVDATPEPQLQS